MTLVKAWLHRGARRCRHPLWDLRLFKAPYSSPRRFRGDGILGGGVRFYGFAFDNAHITRISYLEGGVGFMAPRLFPSKLWK